MVQFTIGVAMGILICSVAGMVGYCIHTERKYPEILDRLRAKMEETEVRA